MIAPAASDPADFAVHSRASHPEVVLNTDGQIHKHVLKALAAQNQGHDLPKAEWPVQKQVVRMWRSLMDPPASIDSFPDFFPDLKPSSSKNEIHDAALSLWHSFCSVLSCDVRDDALQFIDDAYDGRSSLTILSERVVDSTRVSVACTRIGELRGERFLNDSMRSASAQQCYEFATQFFDSYVHYCTRGANLFGFEQSKPRGPCHPPCSPSP